MLRYCLEKVGDMAVNVLTGLSDRIAGLRHRPTVAQATPNPESAPHFGENSDEASDLTPESAPHFGENGEEASDLTPESAPHFGENGEEASQPSPAAHVAILGSTESAGFRARLEGGARSCIATIHRHAVSAAFVGHWVAYASVSLVRSLSGLEAAEQAAGVADVMLDACNVVAIASAASCLARESFRFWQRQVESDSGKIPRLEHDALLYLRGEPASIVYQKICSKLEVKPLTQSERSAAMKRRSLRASPAISRMLSRLQAKGNDALQLPFEERAAVIDGGLTLVSASPRAAEGSLNLASASPRAAEGEGPTVSGAGSLPAPLKLGREVFLQPIRVLDYKLGCGVMDQNPKPSWIRLRINLKSTRERLKVFGQCVAEGTDAGRNFALDPIQDYRCSFSIREANDMSEGRGVLIIKLFPVKMALQAMEDQYPCSFENKILEAIPLSHAGLTRSVYAIDTQSKADFRGRAVRSAVLGCDAEAYERVFGPCKNSGLSTSKSGKAESGWWNLESDGQERGLWSAVRRLLSNQDAPAKEESESAEEQFQSETDANISATEVIEGSGNRSIATQTGTPQPSPGDIIKSSPRKPQPAQNPGVPKDMAAHERYQHDRLSEKLAETVTMLDGASRERWDAMERWPTSLKRTQEGHWRFGLTEWNALRTAFITGCTFPIALPPTVYMPKLTAKGTLQMQRIQRERSLDFTPLERRLRFAMGSITEEEYSEQQERDDTAFDRFMRNQLREEYAEIPADDASSTDLDRAGGAVISALTTAEDNLRSMYEGAQDGELRANTKVEIRLQVLSNLLKNLSCANSGKDRRLCRLAIGHLYLTANAQTSPFYTSQSERLISHSTAVEDLYNIALSNVSHTVLSTDIRSNTIYAIHTGTLDPGNPESVAYNPNAKEFCWETKMLHKKVKVPNDVEYASLSQATPASRRSPYANTVLSYLMEDDGHVRSLICRSRVQHPGPGHFEIIKLDERVQSIVATLISVVGMQTVLREHYVAFFKAQLSNIQDNCETHLLSRDAFGMAVETEAIQRPLRGALCNTEHGKSIVLGLGEGRILTLRKRSMVGVLAESTLGKWSRVIPSLVRRVMGTSKFPLSDGTQGRSIALHQLETVTSAGTIGCISNRIRAVEMGDATNVGLLTKRRLAFEREMREYAPSLGAYASAASASAVAKGVLSVACHVLSFPIYAAAIPCSLAVNAWSDVVWPQNGRLTSMMVQLDVLERCISWFAKSTAVSWSNATSKTGFFGFLARIKHTVWHLQRRFHSLPKARELLATYHNKIKDLKQELVQITDAERQVLGDIIPHLWEQGVPQEIGRRAFYGDAASKASVGKAQHHADTQLPSDSDLAGDRLMILAHRVVASIRKLDMLSKEIHELDKEMSTTAEPALSSNAPGKSDPTAFGQMVLTTAPPSLCQELKAKGEPMGYKRTTGGFLGAYTWMFLTLRFTSRVHKAEVMSQAIANLDRAITRNKRCIEVAAKEPLTHKPGTLAQQSAQGEASAMESAPLVENPGSCAYIMAKALVAERCLTERARKERAEVRAEIARLAGKEVDDYWISRRVREQFGEGLVRKKLRALVKRLENSSTAPITPTDYRTRNYDSFMHQALFRAFGLTALKPTLSEDHSFYLSHLTDCLVRGALPSNSISFVTTVCVPLTQALEQLVQDRQGDGQLIKIWLDAAGKMDWSLDFNTVTAGLDSRTKCLLRFVASLHALVNCVELNTPITEGCIAEQSLPAAKTIAQAAIGLIRPIVAREQKSATATLRNPINGSRSVDDRVSLPDAKAAEQIMVDLNRIVGEILSIARAPKTFERLNQSIFKLLSTTNELRLVQEALGQDGCDYPDTQVEELITTSRLQLAGTLKHCTPDAANHAVLAERLVSQMEIGKAMSDRMQEFSDLALQKLMRSNISTLSEIFGQYDRVGEITPLIQKRVNPDDAPEGAEASSPKQANQSTQTPSARIVNSVLHPKPRPTREERSQLTRVALRAACLTYFPVDEDRPSHGRLIPYVSPVTDSEECDRKYRTVSSSLAIRESTDESLHTDSQQSLDAMLQLEEDGERSKDYIEWLRDHPGFQLSHRYLSDKKEEVLEARDVACTEKPSFTLKARMSEDQFDLEIRSPALGILVPSAFSGVSVVDPRNGGEALPLDAASAIIIAVPLEGTSAMVVGE